MEEASRVFPGPPVFRDIYSISRLNREAKTLLERGFPLLWIEGEISNLARPASGHLYFCLKDAQAQIRCALFKGNARNFALVPRDGMRVLVRARVSLYEGRGEFQLLVEHIEDSGEGALRRAFEALKARLAQEGFFDLSHKRALPALPRRVGVVTSPTGAALRDILSTFKRRFPAISVLLYPTTVQGAGAAERIAAAIHLASERAECDALIVARGGGSLEDLWPFNEEVVARAIRACRIPVVAGVGHETDFTIADLVADVRAPTPTAASELLSPDAEAWSAQFVQYQLRLAKLVRRVLNESTQHLDWLQARLVRPDQRLEELQKRLDGLARRLYFSQRAALNRVQLALAAQSSRLRLLTPTRRLRAQNGQILQHHRRLRLAIKRKVEGERVRLGQYAQALHTLSPLATLSRGYAIIEKETDHAVVRRAPEVKPGERIRALLSSGRLICIVEKVDEDR